MPLKGGLIYHLTCLLYAPYLWKLHDPKNYQFRLNMVSIVVSKMGMTEVIFFNSGMKVNGQHYCDILLCQHMLPMIKHVASNTFFFQRDNAASHRAKTPLNSYSKKCRTLLVLISGHQTAQIRILWIIKSGVLCSRECMNVMNSVDEMKLRLIDIWNSLQQNVIDAAINEWRKQLRACVYADGQHFEYLLRARVTNKFMDK